jgi:hypothetical protein
MSAIIGMTDAELATEPKPDQCVDLMAVKDSANSLLKIIDDAVDYFKTAERT